MAGKCGKELEAEGPVLYVCAREGRVHLVHETEGGVRFRPLPFWSWVSEILTAPRKP